MSLTGGKTLIEMRIMREEEVRVVIEDWPQAKLLIAYKYLRARGLGMDNIDNKIDDALRAEIKQ